MSCKIADCSNDAKFICNSCKNSMPLCTTHTETHDDHHEIKRLTKEQISTLTISQTRSLLKKCILKISQESTQIISSIKQASSSIIKTLKQSKNNIQSIQNFQSLLLEKERAAFLKYQTELVSEKIKEFSSGDSFSSGNEKILDRPNTLRRNTTDFQKMMKEIEAQELREKKEREKKERELKEKERKEMEKERERREREKKEREKKEREIKEREQKALEIREKEVRDKEKKIKGWIK